MPRNAPKKCITCSELSMAEVIELHGAKGDNCWNPKVCGSVLDPDEASKLLSSFL